jgi:hypothetical protein
MARTLGWLLSLALMVTLAPAADAEWDPASYRELDTLQFFTYDAEDGEHWSTVWLVVIDNDVYIRLGARAASRMETSTLAPKTTVRIDDEDFPVIAEAVPTMAQAVADAMKEKYWTDVFVRWINHPLTMRLRLEPPD